MAVAEGAAAARMARYPPGSLDRDVPPNAGEESSFCALIFRAERADRISETARRVFVTYREDQTLLVRNDGPTPVQQRHISLADLVLDAMPGRTVAFVDRDSWAWHRDWTGKLTKGHY